MHDGFYKKLENAWESSGSLLCVGLDPKWEKIPQHLQSTPNPFFQFNREIIDATAPFACAFKPQFAYYAGADRLSELKETIRYIRSNYPEKVIILDSKRGDIGATAREYALESFAVYEADAVTVNPYMGGDTLEPFTDYEDRGVFVLCKTSNLGSSELQNLKTESGNSLFLEVAKAAAEKWNRHRNLALVVGATYPQELKEVRQVVGRMPILVPGIGAQGGDLKATLTAGLDDRGWGVLINSSRGIIYAGNDLDFAKAAATAAKSVFEQCGKIRSEILMNRKG